MIIPRHDVEFGHHDEKIECPECRTRQTAKVEHTEPFWSYCHTCTECGHYIGESEWNRVDMFNK